MCCSPAHSQLAQRVLASIKTFEGSTHPLSAPLHHCLSAHLHCTVLNLAAQSLHRSSPLQHCAALHHSRAHLHLATIRLPNSPLHCTALPFPTPAPILHSTRCSAHLHCGGAKETHDMAVTECVCKRGRGVGVGGVCGGGGCCAGMHRSIGATLALAMQDATTPQVGAGREHSTLHHTTRAYVLSTSYLLYLLLFNRSLLRTVSL